MTVEGPATMTFSPDGRYLAVGCVDQTARLWRTEASGPPIVLGKPASSAQPDPSLRRRVAFSPDGRLLATIGPDGTRLWQLP
jgi:WD40 repeat protein